MTMTAAPVTQPKLAINPKPGQLRVFAHPACSRGPRTKQALFTNHRCPGRFLHPQLRVQCRRQGAIRCGQICHRIGLSAARQRDHDEPLACRRHARTQAVSNDGASANGNGAAAIGEVCLHLLDAGSFMQGFDGIHC